MIGKNKNQAFIPYNWVPIRAAAPRRVCALTRFDKDDYRAPRVFNARKNPC